METLELPTDNKHSELMEFYERSVESRKHVTGIPPTLEIQESVQQFEISTVPDYQRNPDSHVIQQNPGIPMVNLVVSSCNPNNGKLAGGAPTIINGANFLPSAQVFFDNALANNIVFINSSTLSCSPPAYSSSTVGKAAVNVKVVNFAVASEATLVNGYTYYHAPVVTSISPNAGSYSGGSQVTVHGDFFFAEWTQSVAFALEGASTVVRVNDTTLTCYVPTGPYTPGSGRVPVDVRVISTDAEHQQGTATGGYFYTTGFAQGIPSAFVMGNNTIANVGIHSLDDLHVFDPTDYSSAALSFSNASNMSFLQVDPTTVQQHAGVGAFQVLAVLFNPVLPGSFSINIPTGVICNVGVDP